MILHLREILMQSCKIIIKDEVNCELVGLDKQQLAYLYDKFGFHMDGYIFSPAYKLGRWDGKIRFFQQEGKSYVKLLHEIIPVLVSWGLDLDLDDRRVFKKAPTFVAHKDMFSHCIGYGDKPLELRPYQVDIINALVAEGSGFAIAGTGAGKTSISAGLCEVYGKEGYRTITIVPSSDLVTQTADAFRMCQMDVGEYSGDKKELDAQHVIATWQSLQYNPQVMKLFQVVLVDEAHGCKADVIKSLINDHGSHIAFRFGVTGTFPKSEIDRHHLYCSIGTIHKTITTKWLIDNGYLAKVGIELCMTMEDADLPDYASEKTFLGRTEERLDFLSELIIERAKLHGNTLVLVNNISFGRKLTKLVPGSVFLSGDSGKDDRKDNYDMFKDHNDMIVIASSGIASTGISIDRIFCLFLIDSGKSFIKAIQSVGRGLRLSADKKEVVVVDVFSSLKYSKKHSKERIKWYTEAQYPMSKIVKMKY